MLCRPVKAIVVTSEAPQAVVVCRAGPILMEDFHLIEKLQQVTVSALVQALHVADPAALIGPGWAAWLLGPYIDAHPQHVAYTCAPHNPH